MLGIASGTARTVFGIICAPIWSRPFWLRPTGTAGPWQWKRLNAVNPSGGDDLHIKLLKTISVIDLFKERSGLIASFDLLRSCFPDTSVEALQQALSQLDTWSFTIFKKVSWCIRYFRRKRFRY